MVSGTLILCFSDALYTCEENKNEIKTVHNSVTTCCEIGN